ncbi:MAG: phosphoserine phosphatase SerB [Colwellia sp.]|nr:phosphoserine phosphatase SerB [Colwellia sp.]
MTIQRFSLEHIQQLSLAEFIIPEQATSNLPGFVSFDKNSWQINDNLITLSGDAINLSDSPVSHSAIELIVFSNITLGVLSKLITSCQLTLLALKAINHRNGLTSYRFNINCSQLTLARECLVEFTLANNIEAALIENAPILSQPGILVMDMDSTTIEIECIDEIAILAGVGEQVAAVTEQAMLGELDFAQSLHQRVATLKGSPESILAEVADNIPLMNGLETLIKELKRHNWKVAIASGGFTYFSDHLKALLSLDAAHANTLEIIDGTLTGKVLGDVVDAQAKANCLIDLQERYQLPNQQTVAMGDGANDLVMMAAAHLGVAFHAKPLVLAKADSAINNAGLDCLIHWLA